MVSMVTDRVVMGKNGVSTFSAIFHPFLSILAGYNDMYESSEEFEIWLDLTN